MAFGTFTLTGKFYMFGGAPAVGRVQIDGNPQKVIDSAGNTFRVGPRTVVLDSQGAFSITLPSDSTTGNSTGIAYRVTVNLKHQNLAPVSFYARPISTTVDLADIDSIDIPEVAVFPAGPAGPAGAAGPAGPTGPQGLPGVNAVPADTAVASYVTGPSSTATALSGTFLAGVNLPAASGSDDTAALNSVLAANNGRRVTGKRGASYKISAPLVLKSGTTLDMSGCTITLTAGSQCNMVTNPAAQAPLATASDGAITAGSNTVTTSLGAQAVVGQSVTVSKATATGADLLCGIVGAATSTSITVTDYNGKPLTSDTTGTARTVSLYNRDHDIEVVGGYWDRGDNGWSSTAAVSTKTTFNLKRIDRLRISGGTFTCAQKGYNVLVGDVTNYRAADLTFKVVPGTANSDGCVVHGPAMGGAISNVLGYTGDDFVVFHASDNGVTDDTAGDITDFQITNVVPQGSGQSAVKMRAAGHVLRRITINGIHGSAHQGVSLKSIGSTVNDISDIDISDVDTLTDAGLIYIFATGGSNITLRDITQNQPGDSASNTTVYVAAGSAINSLTMDGLNVLALNARGYVSDGVVTFAQINRLNAPGSIARSSLVQLTGTGSCGQLSIAGMKTDMPGTTALLSIAGPLGALHVSDAYIKTGGNLLFTTSAASAFQAMFSNVTLDACQGLASTSSAVDFVLLGLNVKAVTAPALITQGASSVTTVRGYGLVNPGNKSGLSGSPTTAARVVHPQLRVDAATLALNNADTCYNTNASFGGGAGVLICNGSTWAAMSSPGGSGASVAHVDWTLPSAAKRASVARNVPWLNSLAALASGRLTLVGIYLEAGDVINSVTFMAGGTAAVTPTNQWFELRDSNRNLLAQTVDDTTAAWAANAVKTLNLTAPYTVTASGMFYVGVCVAAATVPTLTGVNLSISAGAALAPVLVGSSTTGLTNPASAPTQAAAPVAIGQMPYAAVA